MIGIAPGQRVGVYGASAQEVANETTARCPHRSRSFPVGRCCRRRLGTPLVVRDPSGRPLVGTLGHRLDSISSLPRKDRLPPGCGAIKEVVLESSARLTLLAQSVGLTLPRSVIAGRPAARRETLRAPAAVRPPRPLTGGIPRCTKILPPSDGRAPSLDAARPKGKGPPKSLGGSLLARSPTSP